MSAPWACLLYHDVVAGGSRPGTAASDWFSVSRRSLEEHLDRIRDHGYFGRSIAEALGSPVDGQVAISFDDGDAGQFEEAFPALVSRGMTATFFVTTSRVEQPGFVTWAQLREMKAAGMSIQSHSRTHPFLSQLDAAALREELRTSKADLDNALQQSTDMFALPGGDFPRRALRRQFQEAGYTVVATSKWGTNDGRSGSGVQPLVLRRCTVRGRAASDYVLRALVGDRWLWGKRRVRETVLGAVRSGLGPGRYERWRRATLAALSQIR